MSSVNNDSDIARPQALTDALALQTKAHDEGCRLGAREIFRRFSDWAKDPGFQLAVIYHEYRLCEPSGRAECLETLTKEFPERATELKRQLQFGAFIDSYLGTTNGIGHSSGHSTDDLTEESLDLPESIGRFEILRLIDHGGMGSVFLALDLAMEREVAIKLPRNLSRLSSKEQNRLLKEAQIAGQLDHPHLVDVLEVGRWGSGFYLVSRFADQGNLAQWMQAHPGPHPSDQVIALMQCVCSAVAHCHQRQIVHCDLKPANILFASDSGRGDSLSSFPGTPKVGDFGLARIGERSEASTQTSGLFGTLPYMAPEQIACQEHELGAAADVFALGVILYELLTGRHPFHAETAIELFDRMRLGTPDPMPQPSSVPADIREVCSRCLAPLDERYPSVVELHQDICSYAEGKPIQKYRRSWIKQLQRSTQRPQRIPQAAIACIAGNLAIMTALLGAPLLKLIPGTPIPGTFNELMMDVSKLVLFPHLPMLLVSWFIMRGKTRWTWGNLALNLAMLFLVSLSFAQGKSPVNAYNHDPFTFLMVHLVIFGIAIAMLALQLVAVPALMKK